jgi:phosphoesterase RecJ-like protein
MSCDPLLLCPDPVPAVYSFLPGAQEVRVRPPEGAAAGAYLFLDCGTLERVGPLVGTLSPGLPSASIDHHRSNGAFAELNWVDPGASSTGELLARLFHRLRAPLGAAAGAIYTAIVTDTGQFAFDSTTTETHRWAAGLLAAGVLPAEYHEQIYESRDPAAVRLLGRALGSLRFSAGGKIAYMTLGPADFQELGASREHTEGIVNFARSTRGVTVGILFYSLDGRNVRAAIRSRQGFEANELAARFGGGGHARAAACSPAGALSDAVKNVLACAEEALPR